MVIKFQVETVVIIQRTADSENIVIEGFKRNLKTLNLQQTRLAEYINSGKIVINKYNFLLSLFQSEEASGL